jgi:hypothetical protein
MEDDHNLDEADKPTNSEIFSQYMLMIWDGLGFFGFSDTKLDRFKGEKVTWYTPLKSWRSTPLAIIGLTVMIYIIVNESRNLGDQKS